MSDDMQQPSQTRSVPRLSIVVVAWNCYEMLRQCLAAVLDSSGVNLEVIVVDNASQDRTVERLHAEFPLVTVVANAANVGFAAANNQGFRVARGEFVMLLNPDAYPSTPTTLSRMAAFLDAHPEFAALGCRLVYPDGQHQVGDAGFRPTPSRVIAYASGLPRLLPIIPSLFILQPRRIRAEWIDVDWICGAGLMLRRDVITAVGGLDESYFLYGEDIEWGCRIRAAGYRIAYLRNEVVVHIQRGTQFVDEVAAVSPRWLDGLARCYKETNRGRHWLLFRCAMAGGLLLRAMGYRLLARHGRDQRDARKSRAMAEFARHVWRLNA